MVLSLTLAAIIFIPIIAILGVSPQGATIIGEKGTWTNIVNATTWNTYSTVHAAYGLSSILIFIVPCAILITLLVYALYRTEPKRT